MRRLISAHLAFARADLALALQQDAIFLGLLFGAFALVMLASLTLIIGAFLFIGEAVFGSLGWGALHGTLLLIALAVTLVVVALGRTGADVGLRVFVSALVGAVIGVVFGFSATNWLWLQITDLLNLPVAEEWQVFVTVVLVSAVAGAVIGGLGWAVQSQRSSFLTWFVGGAIVATLFGLFIAIPFGPQVGAALGVTVALALWPTLLGLDLQQRGVDTEALQRKLLPMETIEQAQETMTWLQERTGRTAQNPDESPSSNPPATPEPPVQP